MDSGVHFSRGERSRVASVATRASSRATTKRALELVSKPAPLCPRSFESRPVVFLGRAAGARAARVRPLSSWGRSRRCSADGATGARARRKASRSSTRAASSRAASCCRAAGSTTCGASAVASRRRRGTASPIRQRAWRVAELHLLHPRAVASLFVRILANLHRPPPHPPADTKVLCDEHPPGDLHPLRRPRASVLTHGAGRDRTSSLSRPCLALRRRQRGLSSSLGSRSISSVSPRSHARLIDSARTVEVGCALGAVGLAGVLCAGLEFLLLRGNRPRVACRG